MVVAKGLFLMVVAKGLFLMERLLLYSVLMTLSLMPCVLIMATMMIS